MKNADVRLGNKRRLIKLLYWNNGISKQDISTVLRLSMPTVNLLVSHLEEDGLVEKRRADTSSGGRIPDLLFFKYNARLVVGVEIFQGECVILITDLQGTPQARKKIQARYNDGVTYWQGLRALILQLIEENSFRREDILGVGITMQNSIERYSKVAGALPVPGHLHSPKTWALHWDSRLLSSAIRMPPDLPMFGLKKNWSRRFISLFQTR